MDLSDQDDLKQAIAQELIDKIVSRSEGGKDLRGNGFTGYKKSYKQSDQFSAFNKTNKVNMTLTGDMLGRIDVLSVAGNEIKIGWDSGDSTNNAKAFNHMVADSKGSQKRQFFGLTQKDAGDIANLFASEINSVKEEDREAANVTDFLGALGSAQAVSESGTTVISLEDLFGEG